jgi:hypothetical protein
MKNVMACVSKAVLMESLRNDYFTSGVDIKLECKDSYRGDTDFCEWKMLCIVLLLNFLTVHSRVP